MICTGCGQSHWQNGCEAYQETQRAVWRERRALREQAQGFRYANREDTLPGRPVRDERPGFVRASAGEFFEEFR